MTEAVNAKIVKNKKKLKCQAFCLSKKKRDIKNLNEVLIKERFLEPSTD